MPTSLTAVLSANIHNALGVLRSNASGEAVHTARKELKHARAILRLCADALQNPPHYERAELQLRTAARCLNALRDSEVALHTCAGLLRCSTHEDERTALTTLEDSLRLHYEKVLQRRSQDVANARSQLHECLQASVPLDGIEWDTLAKGLRRSYRKGRKLFKNSRGSGDEDRLHAWRQQASLLRYQLETIGHPRGDLARMARRFRKLADVLGLDRDLYLLASAATEAKLDAALRLLRQRRLQLRRRALKLGSKLYARKPRRFVHRCERARRTGMAE